MIKRLKERIENWSDELRDEFSDAINDDENVELDGFKFELIKEHGGEGQGEEYWKVYKVTEGNASILIRMDGSYASYDGPDFDPFDFRKVKAVKRTVTFYE